MPVLVADGEVLEEIREPVHSEASIQFFEEGLGL
jgi:hypothetical protein